MDRIEFHGEALARHLASEFDLPRVCGAIVESDSALLAGRMRDYVLSVDELADVDVIVMEGGWNHPGDTRFDQEAAKDFVFNGGLLIVEGVGRHEASTQASTLEAAKGLFGAMVGARQGSVCYLMDERNREAAGTRFYPGQMAGIGQDMRATFEGIDSLLAASMIQLIPIGGEIAATGNLTTLTLTKDMFDGEGLAPWTVVHSVGAGYAVLIGGIVSRDALIEENPDNARWLSNLIVSLTDRIQARTQWLRRERPRSAALSSLLDADESQRLERKSSFLVPTDPSRGSKEACQLAVGKSIVALANTDGGHVIIGQADNKEVLGLATDFASLSKTKDRDDFSRAMSTYVNSRLNRKWEALGLRLEWLETPSGDVAVVEVPRQPASVVVTIKSKGEAADRFYVRNGTETHLREGAEEITAWFSHRQRD